MYTRIQDLRIQRDRDNDDQKIVKCKTDSNVKQILKTKITCWNLAGP